MPCPRPVPTRGERGRHGSIVRCHAIVMVLASFGSLLGIVSAGAQPPLDSALPVPRLFTVMPPGGRAGTTVEVAFTGADVEDPQGLIFSDPAIRAGVVLPIPASPADPKKPAPPPPISKFMVTIPAGTPPGSYDVRLVNRWGVSNARVFEVGDLEEVLEKEPNNEIEQAQRVAVNTTINGTIAAPTDVDYYVFSGKKGQRVVVSCLASSIDSRLIAAVEMYDRAGRLLGANHHYRGTDALVDCTIPEDGEYFVRVHEFAYTKGDAEHFYRLSISTAPWIDAVYPPVVEPGATAYLTVFGRNLPQGRVDRSSVIGGRALERMNVRFKVPDQTRSESCSAPIPGRSPRKPLPSMALNTEFAIRPESRIPPFSVSGVPSWFSTTSIMRRAKRLISSIPPARSPAGSRRMAMRIGTRFPPRKGTSTPLSSSANAWVVRPTCTSE